MNNTSLLTLDATVITMPKVNTDSNDLNVDLNFLTSFALLHNGTVIKITVLLHVDVMATSIAVNLTGLALFSDSS